MVDLCLLPFLWLLMGIWKFLNRLWLELEHNKKRPFESSKLHLV